MKLACSSYSYHAELEECMELAEFIRICGEELGVDGVELIDEHLPGDDRDTLDEIRELADAYGLEIACLSVFYNDFAKACRADRREDVENVMAWLDRADRLAADVLRAFTGFPGLHDRDHGDPAVWRDVTTCLQECVDYAETVEATLAIENHNHDGLIRTADDVFRVRSGVNGELGLVLDLANYVDGVDSIDRTAHVADHVHAAYDDIDADGSDPNYPYYDAVLADLAGKGYDGYVTLEWEGEADDFEAVPRAIDYLRTVAD
ncbi:sugar phosphate isomerase/epimerase family protein [Halegenticoccus tardaugens]|uniref:sugar phosphate isomerase/epimerase family protein n=1 Tax=Halegenticoccus tardaugens TaxID=2071624 RepID=UPI00100AEB06|nr:sugar phosphate isomerase/epimerase [Halegenticoccus tardaugens]